jgi:hypothetical protein
MSQRGSQADQIVGNLVRSVTVENGAIHIVFLNKANGGARRAKFTGLHGQVNGLTVSYPWRQRAPVGSTR